MANPFGRAAAALRRVAHDAREFRRFRRRRMAGVPLQIPYAGGAIEAVRVHPDRVVAVDGWTPDLAAFAAGLQLADGGSAEPPTHVFRTNRPDLHGVGGGARLLGATAEFVVESAVDVTLLVNGTPALSLSLASCPATPPYSHLRAHSVVQHRHQIYGSGPPVPHVSTEILKLARLLPAPVLDFGCGAGALVAALRREGVEAYGIELAGPRIETALLADARPFVTLYDGALPLPFRDKSMASVSAIEVLEHIPEFRPVLDELGRIARSTLLVTVPDASAIPRCAAHQVVPWHLLEATHVNFFTQHSLMRVLEPVSSRIEVARLGAVRCDSALFYTSLAATATVR